MKSNQLLSVFLFICSFIFVACESGQEKVSETTKMQSVISSQEQILAENTNLKTKGEEMERDLSARHRFFQGVKGRYEGLFKTSHGSFIIRITLNPNIAPYIYSEFRPFRRLEEIVSDLNNLSFNAQVMQWNPENTLSAVSCQVDSVRPDLRAGEIIISNTACPNLYSIKVTDNENDTFANSEASANVAKRLMDGADDKVDMLVGEIQPSTSAEIYSFKARR